MKAKKRKKKKKKKKKRRRGGRRSSQQGMETEFMYGFYEIMYEFPCLDGYNLAQI